MAEQQSPRKRSRSAHPISSFPASQLQASATQQQQGSTLPERGRPSHVTPAGPVAVLPAAAESPSAQRKAVPTMDQRPEQPSAEAEAAKEQDKEPVEEIATTVAAPEPAASEFSHVIPIANVTRPNTAKSNRTRPGTAQTRFSIEAARNNQRRMVASASGRPRTRGGAEGGSGGSNVFEQNGLALLQQHVQQQRQQRQLQSQPQRQQQQQQQQLTQTTKQEQPHDHNNPSCRECFRAGFDVAVQLQNGQGTAARKALQAFVAAGGLDAISGVEDFYEGSIWGSQAQGGDQDDFLRGNAPVIGQNFVDKLSEVAFGESALSRPVTRGAVQDMLEERSRTLTERQRGKTVDEFLLELQRLQEAQDEETALKETEEEYERTMSASRQQGKAIANERSASPMSAKTMHEAIPSSAARQTRNSGQARRSDVDQAQQDETWQEDDMTEVHSEEDFKEEQDELPFLADRWPLQTKMVHLTICALWIFCVQCVSSGYSASSAAFVAQQEVMPDLVILGSGQFSFLGGQAGGLLVGAALSGFGRHRIQPISVILFAAVSVVIGFMYQAAVLIFLRGFLGMLAGVYEITVIGIILDISTTSRQRFSFFAYIISFIVLAQGAGPWITTLVVHYLKWSWSYWIAAIFGACHALLVAVATNETDPKTIFRRTIYRSQLVNESMVTPEPQKMPDILHILRHYTLRPVFMLFQHGIVAFVLVVLIITFGSAAGIIGPLAVSLKVANHLEEWQAILLITMCILLGLFMGLSSILLFNASSTNDAVDEMAKSETRTRVLYMNEKGIIDAKRPAFNPEKTLRISMAGLLAFVVGMYTLALTTAVISWIFAAFSLTLIVFGLTVLSAGLIQYVSEAYYPSTLTVLGELLSLSQHVGPAPILSQRRQGGGDGNRGDQAVQGGDVNDEVDDGLESDDHSLMSGVDEDGKRWDANWAMSALALILFGASIGAGVMTVLGQLASLAIGFTLYTAILATVVLVLAAPTLFAVFKLGRGMRHRAFVQIAKTEQKIWQRESKRHSIASVADASAATSNGDRRSALSPNERVRREMEASRGKVGRWTSRKLRQLVLPLRQRQEQAQSAANGRGEQGSAVPPSDSQPKFIWAWDRFRKRETPPAQLSSLQISAPFDVQHVATGSHLPTHFPSIAGPATPLQSRRRSTLVEMPPAMVIGEDKVREYQDEQDQDRTGKRLVVTNDLSPRQDQSYLQPPHWTDGRPSLRRVDRKSLQDAIERSTTDQAFENPHPVVANTPVDARRSSLRPPVPAITTTKPTTIRIERSSDPFAAVPFGDHRHSFQSTAERPSVQMADRATNDLMDPKFNDSYQRQVSPPPFASGIPFAGPSAAAASPFPASPAQPAFDGRREHAATVRPVAKAEASQSASPQTYRQSNDTLQQFQIVAPAHGHPTASAQVDGRRAAVEAQRVWLNRVRQSSTGGIDMSPTRR